MLVTQLAQKRWIQLKAFLGIHSINYVFSHWSSAGDYFFLQFYRIFSAIFLYLHNFLAFYQFYFKYFLQFLLFLYFSIIFCNFPLAELIYYYLRQFIITRKDYQSGKWYDQRYRLCDVVSEREVPVEEILEIEKIISLKQ